jgi:hypothetical protein
VAFAKRRRAGIEKRFLTADWQATNLCNPPGERNPCMQRSRFRNGRWLFSARLFNPLCEFVASGLQNFLQNDPVLIDRAPKPEFPPRDRHHDLVEMPNITGAGLPPAQVPGDPGPNFTIQRRIVS